MFAFPCTTGGLPGGQFDFDVNRCNCSNTCQTTQLLQEPAWQKHW